MTQTEFAFEPSQETRQQRLARILAGCPEGVDVAARYFTVEEAERADRLARQAPGVHRNLKREAGKP